MISFTNLQSNTNHFKTDSGVPGFSTCQFCVCLPGVESCATSGTTINVPVKSHLSPAWACSTASALRITSTLKMILQHEIKNFFSFERLM